MHPSNWIPEKLSDFVRVSIASFVRESPLNCAPATGHPIFDEPIVAVADGDDPLFAKYKSIIGEYHLTPRELIAQEASAAEDALLGQLRVMVWALPIARLTRVSNRQQQRQPTAAWAHTRWYGEQFNDALRAHVARLLSNAGYLAVSPLLSPLYRWRNDVPNWPSSTWSERHVAYVAGLGTFSLNDGFITPAGIAVRIGSVVTNAPLPVTPRPYAHRTANCLYYLDGRCARCIERCPAGAITTEGHDKQKCYTYLHEALTPLQAEYGVAVTGCGLCQTGVPCEDRIPHCC